MKATLGLKLKEYRRLLEPVLIERPEVPEKSTESDNDKYSAFFVVKNW